MSQHGGQTHATCWAQQCCDMLRWHVAIVWPGLYTHATCLAKLRKVEGRSTLFATRNATIAVAKCGVTREFFLQLSTQRLLHCKLQEKLLRVTWPSAKC